MEYQKITNLLSTTPSERPITKKWVEVHDQSGDANDTYKPSPSKQIRFQNINGKIRFM